MKRVVLTLLTAALGLAEQHRITLVQELVRLGPMEKRTVVVFPLEQQGAQLEVRFVSKQGGEGVRAVVYETGRNAPLAESKYELNDVIRTPLERAHEYRVEFENLRQRLGEALVDVEITLIFGARSETSAASPAKLLDPRRKLYTILSSVSLFALILAYAAIRLTPPILRRWRGEI